MTTYILHEYEISQIDFYNQERTALILYLREFTSRTDTNTLCDPIDILLKECIKHCSKKCTSKVPTLLSPSDVQTLDLRMLNEWQLKAYISFYSNTPIYYKGSIPEYSRITIHSTILVKEQKDIPLFENIGYQYECDFSSEVQLMVDHILSPVYTLLEHPEVHGITCRCNASNREEFYMLYHHIYPQEKILAVVNIKTIQVKLLLGTDQEQLRDIDQFEANARITNDYMPVYTVNFVTNLSPCKQSLYRTRRKIVSRMQKNSLDALL